MREAYERETEENGPVLTEMRFSQVDSVFLVEYCAEPHCGIGFIKNLKIISILFSACDMIITG